MASFFDDLRLIIRRLQRSPGFLFTATVTLALAIAANVIVAGVANGLIFHRLPVPASEQLVQVQNPSGGLAFSYPNYRDLRDRSTGIFSAVSLARFTRTAVSIGNDSQPIWAFAVSGNYFPMLELQPQIGRLFSPSDDLSAGGSRTIVLSDAFWRTRFQADPKIVGKHLLVRGTPFVVIGVAPQNFRGTEQFIQPEAWLTFHDSPLIDGYDEFEQRNSSSSWVFARLRPQVTRAQADVDLHRISQQMEHDFPKEDRGTAWQTAPVGLLGNLLAAPVRAFISGVALLSLLVLLAACANLGVLFSSRTLDRARELGVRLALGSSRTRILRQLAIEALLIAALGGSAAAGLGSWILHVLSRWSPPTELPIQFMVEADARVYAAAALLAGLTGLLFALLPARRIWRTDPNHTLRGAGTTNVTADRDIFRSTLLVLQIALCCLLVTAAATAFRGLQRTFSLQLGLKPQGLSLLTTDTTLAGHSDAERDVFDQRLLAVARSIPGVIGAAYSDTYPLNIDTSTNDVYPVGTTTFDKAHVLTDADCFDVSPDWFATVGAPLTAGREFTPADTKGAPEVAIVNQTLARQLFGDHNPIGRSFPAGSGRQVTVVGVVTDGKYATLTEDQQSAVFRPILQRHANTTTVLFTRSDRPGEDVAAALRKSVAAVDSRLPVINASSMTDALGLVTFPARAATTALGTVGLLAAMLALTGIFGVASYSVSRRMRELGIRVALGAQASSVLKAALGRTLILLGIGSSIGLALGLASTRLLASIVYHATAADALVLLVAVATMIGLGAIASIVPARKVLRIEPSLILRQE